VLTRHSRSWCCNADFGGLLGIEVHHSATCSSSDDAANRQRSAATRSVAAVPTEAQSRQAASTIRWSGQAGIRFSGNTTASGACRLRIFELEQRPSESALARGQGAAVQPPSPPHSRGPCRPCSQLARPSGWSSAHRPEKLLKRGGSR